MNEFQKLVIGVAGLFCLVMFLMWTFNGGLDEQMQGNQAAERLDNMAQEFGYKDYSELEGK